MIEILISTELTQMTDQAEEALSLEGSVYQRDGLLVHVIRVRNARDTDGITRPEGAPIVRVVPSPHLREILDRAADWTKTDRKGDRIIDALPPKDVVEALAARGQWSKLPSLEAVTETPFLRPDGTICERPGYDVKTGVLLEGPFDGIQNPGTVNESVELLYQPFTEFPFVSNSDRAAVIAAIFSLLARPAIDGPVPLFAIRAPTPGSGKTLLADAIALIATGRTIAKTPPPTDGDETTKMVLALALESSPAVLVDNVSGSFGSPTLAMVMTGDKIKGRLLGASKTVEAHTRMVWFITGNGVTFQGDLARRVVPIDLDSRLENPEDRQGFKIGDLRSWLRSHRWPLVKAALSLLRQYCSAGKPMHDSPPKGSFERWDAIVRGCCVWAGIGDPLGATERIRNESDSDLDAIRGLFASWYDAIGVDKPVTVADLIEIANHNAELRAALSTIAPARGDKLNPRSIGNAMRKIADRPIGGRRVVRVKNGHAGFARWLLANGESGECSESDPSSLGENAEKKEPAGGEVTHEHSPDSPFWEPGMDDAE